MIRQLKILQFIPRWPDSISSLQIQEKLESREIEARLRSIQRDLVSLSLEFPITADESSPRCWSWMEEAQTYDLPQMGVHTALTFRMAEEHLQHVLPKSSLRYLEQHFRTAQNVLIQHKDRHMKNWTQKIHVLVPGMSAFSPQVKQEVLDAVYEGILREQQLKVTYRKREAETIKEYLLHPLGLVLLGHTIYLVCTLWDYENPVNFALHRMESALLLEENRKQSETFDLAEFVDSGRFKYLVGEEPLAIELSVSSFVAARLDESPLSEDQEIVSLQENRLLVKATVPDSSQLRWWILGHGTQVELLRPESLRDECKSLVAEMNHLYQGSNISKVEN